MMRWMSLLSIGVLLCFTNACAGDKPFAPSPLRASFPLYVTIPGTEAGFGEIIEITLDSEGLSKQQTILSQLNFPSGISVSGDGKIFFSENRGAFAGRIMAYDPSDRSLTEILSGLNRPNQLVIDSLGQLYSTTDDGILKINRDGTRVVVQTEELSPDAISFDEKDNLYILTGTNLVKISADGSKESIDSWISDASVRSPVGLVAGSGKRLLILDQGTGLADGAISEHKSDGQINRMVNGLVNPISLALEDLSVPYIAESSPVFRIVRYIPALGVNYKVADLPGIPHSLSFTPRHGQGDSLVKDL